MATASAKQQALVLGLGQTGRSVCRYLLAAGYQVHAMDSRARLPNPQQLPAGIQVTVGGFDADAVTAADLVVLSPGISRSEPVLAALSEGAELVGDVELFARVCQAPVLAVTGTNGKTTVTTLTGQILADAGLRIEVGGNIGTPVLDLLARPGPDYYVLEISSFQLETTHSLRPHAAALLNLTPDHLDRHGDLAHYAAAKLRLLQACAHRVLPRQDALVQQYFTVQAWRSIGTGPAVSQREYGLVAGDQDFALCHGDKVLANCREFALKGRHNLLNIQAALALAESVGVNNHQALAVIRKFTGLPHRTEPLGLHAGVHWINDSKGTNVGATVAALQALDGPCILLAGGQGKGQNFAPLAAVAAQAVRLAIVFGQDREQLAEVLRSQVSVREVKTLEQAVTLAEGSAVAGDCVLLSPACASFDQFSSYQERGNRFRQLVRELRP
ncbi:MAG TPA: UDP-N-acetylmuramoyl-L-alanine--D-glutamate ligase [Gammaproteobacteria bacterium]|nr:UDP-N-acetylmuramoyl-L-alanine--D-glutamate ligase [Gammaproteobacteria bacterium]